MCSKLWSYHAIGQLELNTGRHFLSRARPVITKLCTSSNCCDPYQSIKIEQIRVSGTGQAGARVKLVVDCIPRDNSLFNVQYMLLKAPFPDCQLQLSHTGYGTAFDLFASHSTQAHNEAFKAFIDSRHEHFPPYTISAHPFTSDARLQYKPNDGLF